MGGSVDEGRADGDAGGAVRRRDPAIASKVVVFDDPFNSQDAFRRRQTVHEITKVAGKTAR